jgi:hypothetical protein
MMALVRSRGRLSREGLLLWAQIDGGDVFATTQELTEDLDVLGVPYTVRLIRSAGPWKTVARRLGVQSWACPFIAWDDLDQLAKWMPTVVGRLRDAVLSSGKE